MFTSCPSPSSFTSSLPSSSFSMALHFEHINPLQETNSECIDTSQKTLKRLDCKSPTTTVAVQTELALVPSFSLLKSVGVQTQADHRENFKGLKTLNIKEEKATLTYIDNFDDISEQICLLNECELNNSNEWQTIAGGNLDESLNEREIFDDDVEFTTLSETELLNSHSLGSSSPLSSSSSSSAAPQLTGRALVSNGDSVHSNSVEAKSSHIRPQNLCEICSYNTNNSGHGKLKGHSGNHLGPKKAKKSSNHVDKTRSRKLQSSSIFPLTSRTTSSISVNTRGIAEKMLCPKCTFNLGHTDHDKLRRHCGVCVGVKKTIKK